MGHYVKYVPKGDITKCIDTRKVVGNQKPITRVDGSLTGFNKIELSDIPCTLEDDGKPLKNEFLEDERLREEKRVIKEKAIFENHKEESYKEFVKDLLEASDDIFDSKGDDISEKDFLKNEMDLR